MKQEELVIGFAKWPPDFDYQDNFIVNVLRKHYRIAVGKNPQIVFYSIFRGELPPGNYTKVFFTGENRRPPMDECDWAFSFDYDEHLRNPRHMRLPLYVLDAYGMYNLRSDWGQALIKSDHYAEQIINRKADFCAYIAYHNAWPRTLFFEMLSKKKTVIAPGRSGNNAPPIAEKNPVSSRSKSSFQQAKRNYLSRFKFTIAFENSSYPGYTTEKLADAMLAGCIPIYWGNPDIERDFNPDSFVNVHEYEAKLSKVVPSILKKNRLLWDKFKRFVVTPLALKKTMQHVLELERDTDEYLRMLNCPWFKNNIPNQYYNLSRFEQQLMRITATLNRQES